MTKEPRAGAELTDDALQDEIDRALGIERGHPTSSDDAPSSPHRVWKRQNA